MLLLGIYIALHSFYRTNLFSLDTTSPFDATIRNRVLHWPQRWAALSYELPEQKQGDNIHVIINLDVV